MSRLTSFASGIVFGVGLALSGMTQPSKVVGFLDFTGGWDPSLAFVMVGAIAVYAAAFRVLGGRPASLLGLSMRIPQRVDMPPRLFVGAGLFGLGWGLAGFCPGPAIASLGALSSSAALFTAAMAAGMAIARRLDRGEPDGDQAV